MKKYNLDLLKEQCGNDKKFFNEMLDIFTRSTLEGVSKLEEACQKNDLKQMGHYAHKILSPCKHIDAENLIPLLKEIEDNAETPKLSGNRATELVTKIRTETDELIKNLKSEYL